MQQAIWIIGYSNWTCHLCHFTNIFRCFWTIPTKRNRMEEKLPATQPWLRRLALWSQLVAFKCVPEGHFEAICPKYMPCTGAQNPGATLLYYLCHLIWFSFLFLHFMFGSILVYHIRRMLKSYFTPQWILMHQNMQLIKLGGAKKMLRHNIGPSCFAAGTYWKNSNA